MGAPPSPYYIPGPEAPPSPGYISGPKYPEYLPPADDMILAEEQPLPDAVSPTAESPGYITDSEPEMEPEENDGDDEKSKGDSIDYPTEDNDANDDGDDLSEDDADDEDEEEEEEHLALTVPTPALYSRLSRERRYFHTVATTYAREVAHSRDYCTQITDYCQSREVHTRTLVTRMEALRRDVSTL
nr:hypothetical protein [Tanacetum cinerariifolium]